MKIGFVSTAHAKCGISTYTNYIGKALQDQGVEVVVFGERSKEREPYDLRSIDCWSRTDQQYTELEDVVEKEIPDVVHWQYEWSLHQTQGPFTELAQPRPHAWTWHNIILDQKDAWYGGLVDRSIVHSQIQGEALMKLGMIGYYPRYLPALIPHGTSQNTITDTAEAKEKIGIDPKRKVIATFGFVQPRKGQHLILGNFDRVKKYCPEAFYLAIGGRHPKGDLWNQGYSNMFDSAKELYPDDFMLTDFVSDEAKIDLYLSAADAIVFPHLDIREMGQQPILSVSGSTHRTIDHAKLMITTDMTFYAEFTPDMAVKIPLGDPFMHFGRWLGRTLAHSDDQESMARKAKLKQYAQATYWPRVAQMHIELYKQMLARRL